MIKKEKYCVECKMFKDNICTTKSKCAAEDLYENSIEIFKEDGTDKTALSKTFRELIDLAFEENKASVLSIFAQAFADYLKENKIVEVE